MDLAKHWRLRAARYRLEGQRHRTTGEVRFPAEPATDVAAQGWEPYSLSGAGMIYSFSVVRQPPAGYEEQTPYILALVRLAEGPLITAQLTDCDPQDVTIDMPVEMTTRRLRDLGPDGLIVYGYKFRPRLMNL
ncbi:MAG TPA: Zn-ribbon domain-containing OB-fold protein [Roseiflexaceae bacterium]|nr:Zn-ribbon domain-containing OB-fold protein [Roseiflexaceae bacterium]